MLNIIISWAIALIGGFLAYVYVGPFINTIHSTILYPYDILFEWILNILLLIFIYKNIVKPFILKLRGK